MATSVETVPNQNDINESNGILPSSPDHNQEVDSEDEVRRHTSSSVSKTKPPGGIGAVNMDDVKQKIDFTDDVVVNENRSLSPVSVEDPVSITSSAPPSLNVSINEDEGVASQFDQQTTVQGILDRLETVRSYTEDAHSLYQQLQEDEPNNADQMERVSVLISQLKQQELSYLQVLLKLMEDRNIDDTQLGELELMMNRPGEEYEGEEGESDEGEEPNSSMSLRAEMIKSDSECEEEEGEGSDVEGELAEQQREIAALHEQRALLMRLKDQQSQLESLQSRQSQLLELKREAEERLSDAKKQCDELGDVSLLSHDQSQEVMRGEEPEDGRGPVVSERERILMAELQELKQRKRQAEMLMEGLTAVPESIKVTSPSEHASDELVDSNLHELRSKMRQIEEARHKMKELQEMVGMLQGMALSKEETGQKKPQGKIKAPPTANLDESQDDEVIHMLADYERNIGHRQSELDAIRRRKEELRRVEEMLQDIQLMTKSASIGTSDGPHYSDPDENLPLGEPPVQKEEEGVVGQKLASELVRQQELYADLRRKTQQLKQLQQEIEKYGRASDHDSAVADTTVATWGGSSVASMVSVPQEDEGKDPTDPSLPQYQVDRHTPRNPRPLRRAYSPHDDQDSTIGKKIKLEPPGSGNTGTPNSKKAGPASQQHHTPSVNKRSAVWPSVIFSQSASKSGAGKVQTPPSFSCPKVVPTPVPSGHAHPHMGEVIPNDYTHLLQQQLANSSAMCFQLMEHQASLLQALNQKLDTLPHIHEQMIQLHEYHDHLQGYHEYLNGAYWQLMDSQKEAEPQEEDEGEEEDPTVNSSPTRPTLDDSFSRLLPPPPHPLGVQHVVNSPFQRPPNPHLQASPDTKRLRPFSRPGYPYSLYGRFQDPMGVGTHNQQTQCGKQDMDTNPLEVESASSLPDKSFFRPLASSGGGSGFDKLRDTIYSEVASLIASNEDRPNFLVELFRELQLLNTDYLRQRALYSITELVTRFLKAEEEATLSHEEANNSLLPLDDADLPPTKRGISQRFDYTEPADSASSVSTPPIMEEPFASDVLGDTVIKTCQTELPSSDIELDTDLLDEEIKAIMTNVIPLLKCHLTEECDHALLSIIRSAIIDQVLSQDGIKVNGDLGLVFTEQLQSSLMTTMEKHQGKILKNCGEDLLVDVSEVLFNEVAFYRLIKETQGIPGKDYYTSGSQTTTDKESTGGSPQRPVTASALTLQTLGTVISKTLQDESESLGNNRDDELAKVWEPDSKERSTPVDNPNKDADKVQSSPSKKNNNKTTAPIVKEGSPELDNAGSNGTLKKEDDKSKDGEDDMIEEGYVNVTGTSSGLMSPPVEITAPPTEILTPPTEANNKEGKV